jgi:hypothetical protein
LALARYQCGDPSLVICSQLLMQIHHKPPSILPFTPWRRTKPWWQWNQFGRYEKCIQNFLMGLTMVYNIKNYWGFGLCAWSCILETRKNFSETGCVSVLRWDGKTPTPLFPLERADLKHNPCPVIEVTLSKGPNWAGVFLLSSEDVNRCSFRNYFFFQVSRIPDHWHSPKTQYFWIQNFSWKTWAIYHF